MASNRTCRLACAAMAFVAGGCARQAQRPNVLVIVVDTLRVDHLGAYGYERPTSPNIDALARRSILFQDATTAASWTNPAMVALFTGLAPEALGEMPGAIKIPAAIETLGETFQRAGYATHGVISHLYLNRKHGFDQGFDSWDEENALGHAHVSSESISDKAIAILEESPKGEPFFLFLHYFDPHYDYLEHEAHRFSGEYTGKFQSLNDNFVDLRKQAKAGAFGPADIQHLNDLYDSEIAFTDEHLGRVLDELERRGLMDDTLVVLTADHGEALCERPDFELGHSFTVFQNLVHVPLLIKLPGAPEPRVVRAPVSTQNVLGTLIDCLGLPDGRGLAQASLLGPDRGEALFTTSYSFVSFEAARQGRWKLIHNFRTGTRELFDLAADPGETTNLADAEPEVLARLEQLRVAWKAHNAGLRGLLATETPDLTEAEQEQLRLLGYTD